MYEALTARLDSDTVLAIGKVVRWLVGSAWPDGSVFAS
jgi:hypothetical protein